MKTFILKTLLLIVLIFIVLHINMALADDFKPVESYQNDNHTEVINTETFTPIEQIKYVFGDNWEIAYAVMMSEGGGNPKAINYNTDSRKTHDRGLFQINSYWHSDVSDECAYDIQCNVQQAYRISKGGTDWTPWYGYTKGKYLEFL